MAFKRIEGFLTSPHTGATLVLLTAVWEVFWLVGPPLGLDFGVNSTNRGQYLSWGFLAFFVACVHVFATQQSKIRHYQRVFEPETALVFDRDNTNHVQPGTVKRKVSGQIPWDEYLCAIGEVLASVTVRTRSD